MKRPWYPCRHRLLLPVTSDLSREALDWARSILWKAMDCPLVIRFHPHERIQRLWLERLYRTLELEEDTTLERDAWELHGLWHYVWSPGA